VINQPGIHLIIANTIIDLVQGDIKEHLPVARIPLRGDVLGFGTTTSIDNGELTFIYNEVEAETAIFKCHANTGGIHKVCPGDGSDHFPYVCFSSDATDMGCPIDLSSLNSQADWRLADWVAAAIDSLDKPADLYGVRARCQWDDLVITVASKLCLNQGSRNTNSGAAAGLGSSIYDSLQHYLLSAKPSTEADDKIQYLGDSLEWDCCGFFDTQPEKGRVTVAQAGANLHIHGVSVDHRYGGHLHHEHGRTRLLRIDELVIYPIETIDQLGSDLAITDIDFDAGTLRFRVSNCGAMDVSDIGIDVVPDNRYSERQYLRLPWLAAGDSENFSIVLSLASGAHQILVAVDPVGDIIEPEEDRKNNRVFLDCVVN
jgi:hypothetical protein|tara:strand:+ start:272 stop:1387 length:1116 start_codon:yes stop_codon:yes gene_type:complete